MVDLSTELRNTYWRLCEWQKKRKTIAKPERRRQNSSKYILIASKVP